MPDSGGAGDEEESSEAACAVQCHALNRHFTINIVFYVVYLKSCFLLDFCGVAYNEFLKFTV